MPPNPQLASQIYQEALSQGVPPQIALAVAQKESGIQQLTPSGDLVTGSAGEIGVFQLMPATADGLGVDPTDPNENVQGGVSLLSQLYAQYGNWPAALSAYNSGSPTNSLGYANSVLSMAGTVSAAPSSPSVDLLAGDSADESAGASGSWWLLVPVVGLVGLALLLD